MDLVRNEIEDCVRGYLARPWGEYAPRVHNTDHRTLLGSVISRFERWVRTILDYHLVVQSY